MEWGMFAEIWKYNMEVLKYFSAPVSEDIDSMFYEPITIKRSGGLGPLSFEKNYINSNDNWMRNYILMRSIINDCACAISMINERIGDVKPIGMSTEDFKKLIDENIFIVGDYSGLCLQELRENDLVDQKHIDMSISQKFRNGLAHANFDIVQRGSSSSDPIGDFALDRTEDGSYCLSPSGVKVRIDNEHITGEIELSRLMDIASSYYDFYRELYKQRNGETEYSSIEEFMSNKFSNLSDKDKGFISRYINKYIGNEKWENASDEVKLVVLETLVDFRERKVLDPSLNFYKTYQIGLGLFGNDWVNQNEANAFIKPIFYVNQLLSSAFFVFDYARELNHSNAETKGTFDYFNINVLGINPYFKNSSRDKLFSRKNTEQEAIDERDTLRRNYKKYYLPAFKNVIALNAGNSATPELDDDIKDNIINGIIRKIKLDEPEANLDNYRKLIEKMLSRYKISDLSLDEKTMRSRILKTIADVGDSLESVDVVLKPAYEEIYNACDENYMMRNYSNLARHLRNAIAHGYYDIDFSNLTGKVNLNQLPITLFDYDEGDNEPCFSVTMTAGKMIKLINSFATNIDQQLTKGNYDTRVARRDFVKTYPKTDSVSAN